MEVEVVVLDSPSLTVLMVSVDVRRHLKEMGGCQNEELNEGRGGRPGLPTVITVSVDATSKPSPPLMVLYVHRNRTAY